MEGFHLVVVSQLAKAPELYDLVYTVFAAVCTVLYCTYSTRYLAKLHCQEFQSRGYNLDQCTESQRYNVVS